MTTFGRDTREPDLTMRPAAVFGGREPQLLAEGRAEVIARLLGWADAFTTDWTDRRPDDAGAAILDVHATLLQAAHLRINRIPRRLALDCLRAAGVRPLPATAAQALGAIEVDAEAAAAVEVSEGTVFGTASGPVLETGHGCSALPGRLAGLAVLSDGWLALDRLIPPYNMMPFGRGPRPPAELWLGFDVPIAPAGTMTLAVRLLPAPGRASATVTATENAGPPPLLRWEAMTTIGPVELAAERDGTAGLASSGVIAFRIPAALGPSWTPIPRPGQVGGTPLRWLRARLLTSSYPVNARLREIVLNGVEAVAARSIRDEIAEPVDRPATGGSRFRLSQIPVLPGSVVLEIAESAGLGSPETTGFWSETAGLATAQPDDQVFTLDPATGVLTFGDGVAGRAAPEGYRNVVARQYRIGGGTAGLPRAGDLLPSEVAVPDLGGVRVLTITTGSAAETPASLTLRGPAVIRSRQRAVAAADYATAALATPGVSIARAHCLPGVDPTAARGATPGTLGIVVVPRTVVGAAPGTPGAVVPRTSGADRAPTPDAETLRAVADHLAAVTGVVGARVVAVAPVYREVSVRALLAGAPGADLAQLVSAARDRIDDWLDPITGADGMGWPFGGPVRWQELVRMLLAAVPRLEAVSQVSFQAAERPLPACADVVLAAGELVRPGTHLLEAGTGAR